MKKSLILLFSLFLFSSCESQIGTAIGSAFTNILSGNGFSDSSSDQVYEQMKKDQIAKKNSTGPGITKAECLAEGPLMVPVKDMGYLSKIKDQLCSCKVWGSCDKASCSCEVMCPKNFDILKMNDQTKADSPENSLSFTNGDKDFYENYSDYTGFCWGHAIVTQRFNRLATFSPKLTRKFTSEEDNSLRLREYKNIIAKLDNNEPVDIHGFKNLKEFSSDPEVKDLLEESVKKNWAQNAMSTQGLSMVASGEPQGLEYYNTLFDDLEFRLKNNQSPAIVFNARENSSKAHTVMVNGSGKTNEGLRYICLRDNNYAAEKSLNCQNKMILSKEGTISYNKWYPPAIGKVKLSYSENSHLVEQINNLHSKCRGDKNCDNRVLESNQ